MKTVKRKVNAGGKLLGEIDVPQYDSTVEAAKDLTEKKALSLLNRQLSSDFTNEFRASQTRETSPISKLGKIAKTNPELDAQIAALVKKYAPKADIPVTPPAAK